MIIPYVLVLLALLQFDGIASSPQEATVRIRLATQALKVGILRFDPYPNLPDVVLEISEIKDGICSFRFTPDPDVTYSVKLGQDPNAVTFSAASGDSLDFELDSSTAHVNLVYDKIGANLTAKKLANNERGTAYVSALHDTSSGAYARFEADLTTLEKQESYVADDFASRYPEHLYLVREIETRAKYFRASSRAEFIHLHDEKNSTVISNSERNWIDTVSLSFAESDNPWRVVPLVSNVLEERVRLWYWAGKDTADTDPYGLQEETRLASHLEGPARRVASYWIALTADGIYPATSSVPIIETLLSFFLGSEKQQKFVQMVSQRLESIKERQPGVAAKEFKLRDRTGAFHTLTSYNGKAVVLHFWATWCTPCREQQPAFIEFVRTHSRDTNLVVIGIALQDHDFDKWKDYVVKNDLRGQELYAEGSFQSEVATQYLLNWVPTYMVLDRAGRFVSSREKAPPNEQLEADILRAETSPALR